MVEVGLRKQLLMDDYAVEDVWKLRRTMHQPRRHPAGPVLVKDRPWEGLGPMMEGSVLRDEERGVLRLWYEIFDAEGYRKRVGAYQACYAESRDGIHWDKPDLAQFEWQGSTANNILRIGSNRTQGFAIQRFDHVADPDRRYWMVYCDSAKPYGSGLCLAFSPDGLGWTPYDGNPIAQGHSDTTHSLVWDGAHSIYTVFMRPPVYAGPWKRRIARITSEDGLAWSEPETVLTPDELDTPEMYGMPVSLHDGLYLGRLQIFSGDQETIHLELAWSRDGRHWHRHPERPVWLPLGKPGAFDSHMVAASPAPIRVGDELWQYYGGWNGPHSESARDSAIGIGTLRLDGFVSRDAGEEEGVLLTRPFVLEGSGIEINAAAQPGGFVAGELWGPSPARAEGDAFPGFSRAECDTFGGDSSAHRLTWRGSADVSSLRGRVARLRLHLKQASLYAFQVVQ